MSLKDAMMKIKAMIQETYCHEDQDAKHGCNGGNLLDRLPGIAES
jgi:hypothetical protein